MADNPKKNPSATDVLAGEVGRGWDSIERLSSRVESYGILKQKTQQFTEWARSSGVSKSDARSDYRTRKIFRNLERCGSYLIFRLYPQRNVARLLGACSCRNHLLCAYCAARRGVRFSMAYKEKFLALQEQFPDHVLDLVTFTVKNGEDLTERFNHLRTAMQRLQKRRVHSARGRENGCALSGYIGGVYAYEVKRGDGSGQWHPHIHGLFLRHKNTRIDWSEMKSEWHMLTGDSHNVNFQPVTDDSAFLEVFAYALKFSDLEHPDRWFAYQMLNGERMVSSFGEFRGVEVPEAEGDDQFENEPFVDVFYQWMQGRYSLHDTSERLRAA